MKKWDVITWAVYNGAFIETIGLHFTVILKEKHNNNNNEYCKFRLWLIIKII